MGPDFQALFQGAPGLYLALTPDLRIIAASDAYLRAAMITRESVLGRGIFDVFPDNPDDAAASGVSNLRDSLERVLRTRKPDVMPVQKYDVRRPEADGGLFEERYWSPLNTPVCGTDGAVRYIVHRVEDVTEFIRLKHSGRERDRLAQALQDRADAVEAEVYERAQQVAEANRQLTRANDELAGLYDRIAQLMERADDELRGVAVPNVKGTEAEARTPITPVEMLARVGRLIADHKSLEAQLYQSQKMEAVGRLAGGVAHDFNNLLTVIMGYLAMLREDPSVDSVRLELDEIERASIRAAALTQKLLAFSRKQVLQPRIINPNAVAAGMEEMLRRLIGEDLMLEMRLGSGVNNVKADPHQLEQVIMNLVVNARDAMPEGGRIVVETGNALLDGAVRALKPGRYVIVTVTDTGHGMTPETASRAFEPFFTTKALGKGTGLGLSTVYGIVEQTGGTITLDTAPEAGCKFRVYIPATDAAEDPTAVQSSAIADSNRPGTILLVEDETALRSLIAKTLAAAGHQLLQAVNGQEALELAASHQGIDVLLTDVVMPGMSGPELVARLRALRPTFAVLYMSGYDHQLIDQTALERSAGFIAKPFTPRALLQRINQMLQR